MKKKPTVASLFSGCGGMDLGFSQAGYKILWANDFVEKACDTYAHNIGDHIVCGDITKINLKTIPDVDVIIGGFPCQDFSHAGKRQGFDAARGTLYQSYVELVKRVQPLIFVAENVNGLLTMPGEPIKQIISDFAAVGYEVKYELIKCEEFGIPQTRWRVIIMGVRLDKRHLLVDNWSILTENKIRCTIGHYFKHLAEPDVTQDPAQKVYSKAALLEKGQGQKEVELDKFAPTMRAEQHGNFEFSRLTGGRNG
jgi:DNA (cytosine-5)-methyltransferase 1